MPSATENVVRVVKVKLVNHKNPFIRPVTKLCVLATAKEQGIPFSTHKASRRSALQFPRTTRLTREPSPHLNSACNPVTWKVTVRKPSRQTTFARDGQGRGRETSVPPSEDDSES
ncbi:hypothetical protein OUZ56_026336 [Daphnia magna]|uniref:Uncharacterized protein n=1 Tax=Daphnia magna TaxID=35525 RepID=A0ABQ9ZLG1_9CRUS|nr:hypothetical protein OUZ56_026336 [Daphnia magna]